MVSHFNRLTLEANLVTEPEVRQVGDKPVTSCRVASNRRWKAGDGEMREETVYLSVEAWGLAGKILAEDAARGDRVLLDGRLKFDEWEHPEKGRQSKHSMTAFDVRIINKRSQDGGGAGEAAPPTEGAEGTTADFDEVPF